MRKRPEFKEEPREESPRGEGPSGAKALRPKEAGGGWSWPLPSSEQAAQGSAFHFLKPEDVSGGRPGGTAAPVGGNVMGAWTSLVSEAVLSP